MSHKINLAESPDSVTLKGDTAIYLWEKKPTQLQDVMLCPHCNGIVPLDDWISVKDALPEPLVPVLIWDRSRICFAEMPNETEYNEHWHLCDDLLRDEIGCTGAVVCWMHIHAIPEEFK